LTGSVRGLSAGGELIAVFAELLPIQPVSSNRGDEMFKKNLTTQILLVLAVTAVLFFTGCSKNKENTVMNDPQIPPANGNNDYETAMFAAGCFWHVEAVFSETPGVISTTVGYAGGTAKNPTYKMVCSDKTGHAETVQVVFDRNRISYSQLLDVFWGLHDPTQLNCQGPDIGSQYRSVIFCYNEAQRRAAVDSKAKLEASGKYSRPIVTRIVPAGVFYRAEEYHQQYYKKHGLTRTP
jgi:peptide-methionine (S)-S-oxide reductase